MGARGPPRPSWAGAIPARGPSLGLTGEASPHSRSGPCRDRHRPGGSTATFSSTSGETVAASSVIWGYTHRVPHHISSVGFQKLDEVRRSLGAVSRLEWGLMIHRPKVYRQGNRPGERGKTQQGKSGYHGSRNWALPTSPSYSPRAGAEQPLTPERTQETQVQAHSAFPGAPAPAQPPGRAPSRPTVGPVLRKGGRGGCWGARHHGLAAGGSCAAAGPAKCSGHGWRG